MDLEFVFLSLVAAKVSQSLILRTTASQDYRLDGDLLKLAEKECFL